MIMVTIIRDRKGFGGLTDALSRHDRALQERDGDSRRSEARETGRVCAGDLCAFAERENSAL